MRFISRCPFIVGLMLFFGGLAHASVLCEIPLNRPDTTPYLVKAIKDLVGEGKLSNVELSALAADLANSDDGLTLSPSFLKNRTDIKWIAIQQMLSLVAKQAGVKNFGSQLKDAWRALSSDNSVEVSIGEGVTRTKENITVARVINNFKSFCTLSQPRFLQLFDGQKKILFNSGPGIPVLVDVSPGHEPAQVDLKLSPEPNSQQFINAELLIDHAIWQDKEIYALKFSDRLAPTKTNVTKYFKDTSLDKFLRGSGGQVKLQLAIAPGKVLFVTEHSTSRLNDIHYVDTNSLTTADLSPLPNFSGPSHPTGFLLLPGERVFVYGEGTSTGILDFSKADTANNVEAHWTPEEENPYKPDHLVEGAISLSDGSVVTRGQHGTLTRWVLREQSYPKPKIIRARRVDNHIRQIFEIAPNEILSLGSEVTHWDLRNPEKPIATNIPLPRGIRREDRDSDFKYVAEFSPGHVFAYSQYAGLTIFTHVPGQTPSFKSIPMWRSNVNVDHEPIITPLSDHEALVFFNNGNLIYASYAGDKSSTISVNEVINELNLKNEGLGIMMRSGDDTIIATTTWGKLVEIKISALRHYLEGK